MTKLAQHDATSSRLRCDFAACRRRAGTSRAFNTTSPLHLQPTTRMGGGSDLQKLSGPENVLLGAVTGCCAKA